MIMDTRNIRLYQNVIFKKETSPRLSNSCTVTNPFLVLNCIAKNVESQIKSIHQGVIDTLPFAAMLRTVTYDFLFLQFHLYNRRQRRIINLK